MFSRIPILVMCFVLSSPSFAEAAKTLGTELPCHRTQIEHGVWTKLLKTYVQGGHVDYTAWLASEPDRKELRLYLQNLTGVCLPYFEGLSDPARLAHWINLYNAAVIDLVLENYPLKTIKAVGPPGENIFNLRFIPLAWVPAGKLSLNELERDIIRPRFEDARTHFALVCAARGCPPLRSEAFTAAKLDRQLKDQTLQFFRDPAQITYDPSTNTLSVSQLFNWYREDFADSKGSVLAYLKKWLSEAGKPVLQPEPTVKFRHYPWELNHAVGQVPSPR